MNRDNDDGRAAVGDNADARDDALDRDNDNDNAEAGINNADADTNQGEGANIQQLVPLLPYVTRRVTLTDEERTWAVNIRNAMEEAEDVTKMSDFWIAQMAIIDRDDTENALDRARRLQYFFEEYDIADTEEEGGFLLEEFTRLFPGLMLGWNYSPQGHQCAVMDCSKFYVRQMSSPAEKRIVFGALYYILNALNPDFEATRKGAIILSECEGISFGTNFGLEISKRYWQDLGSCYPIQYDRYMLFHTGVFMNVMCSMLREVMPRHLRPRFEVGCHVPGGRLDRLYLTPTAEAATERLLLHLKGTLQLRYANDGSFILNTSTAN